MINGFDPTQPRFLSDLSRIQDRMNRAQRQISSGLRVETASDAPESVLQILRLRSRIDANTQLQTNLTRITTQVKTADSALREAVSLLERGRVLAAQTATSGAVNRTTMAIEAQQLHARLVALTGVTTEGQFVFGGDGAVTAPYVSDAAEPNGVEFVGASTDSTLLVADENHVTFSVSRTASEIFDAPGADNAFAALHDLTTALANDDEAAVQAALPGIKSALDHLNRQLAFYGHAQNRVTAAFEAAKKNAVQLNADLATLQEADLPAAILELNNAKVHHEAALSAKARATRSTLFDYMG